MTEDAEEIVPTDSFLDLNDHLELFTLVSNDARFRILHRLVIDEERSVSDLAADLDRDKSTISHHLNLLVEAGIVRNRREKRTGSAESYSYYTATPLGNRLYETFERFIKKSR